jgi:hypothetical protein
VGGGGGSAGFHVRERDARSTTGRQPPRVTTNLPYSMASLMTGDGRRRGSRASRFYVKVTHDNTPPTWSPPAVITANSSSDQQLQRASRPSQAHMLLQGVGGGGHAWGAWGVAPHGVVAGWARAHTSSAVGPPEMDEGSTHCSTQCNTKCTHCMPEPHQCAHALPSERARTRASIRAQKVSLEKLN